MTRPEPDYEKPLNDLLKACDRPKDTVVEYGLLMTKRRRRLDGFADRTPSFYVRTLTAREIQGHLEELY